VRVLLLHLSDIHIRGAQDHILKKAPLIAAAVQSLETDYVGCLVIVSGDIAAKGQSEEYALAQRFLADLHQELRTRLKIDIVSIVTLPGNHDCDFSTPQKIRTRILESLLADQSDLETDEIATILALPQENFRRFQKELRDCNISPSPVVETAFHSQYEIFFGDSIIQINALNTALMSQLQESPSKLHFPVTAVPSATDKAALSISSFHHPYQWLHPDNARQVRAAVETFSDLILTGHEHSASHRQIVLGTGENFTHIEAPVLQDAYNIHNSGFNFIVLDLAEKKQKSFEFTLHGLHYSMEEAEESHQWTDFSLNKIRTRSAFPLSVAHESLLDDPGVGLRSGDRTSIKLSDFYVYPDLREFDIDKPGSSQVRGEKVATVLAFETLVLVTGDTCSRKTALARNLCRAFHNRGELPLLLVAEKNLLYKDKIKKILNEAISSQYDASLVERYWQMDLSRRVLIVDNFERIASRTTQASFIDDLKKRFGRIIFVGADFATEMFDLSAAANFETKKYRIQPFGHLHRDNLVEKWLCINPDIDATALARKVVETTRTLNNVVGSGYVPAYPVYVLAILQACEAAIPVDTSISTHGYYFELLIRSALLSDATAKDYDVLTGYLAYIAFRMFSEKIKMFTNAEFRNVHTDYERRYDIQLSMERLQERLVIKRMLLKSNDTIEFKYPYIYNYFVASYLRDHLEDLEIRASVGLLADNTHRRTCSDILLFLAHLSKDRFVIDTLLARAERHYPNIEKVARFNEISSLGDVNKTVERLTYEDRDVRQTRKEFATVRDEMEESHVAIEEMSIEDEFNEVMAPVREVISALRTMQVIGQILKNYPGHLEADTKLRLAQGCYGIGARAWRSVYNLIIRDKEDIAKSVIATLQEKKSNVTLAMMQDSAEKAIWGLLLLCSFGFILGAALSRRPSTEQIRSLTRA
jgi:Calcineurin-like phosphoesterase